MSFEVIPRFRRVSYDLVPDIIAALQDDLPASLLPCQLLEMYVKCTRIVPERDIRLYTPDGIVDKYGTYLQFAPDHRYGIQFHTTDPDLEKIKKMILAIEDIDWSKNPVVGPVHNRFHGMIHDLMKEKNLRHLPPLNPADNLLIDREDALNLEIRCPTECELRPITVDDAKFIDDRWPHRNDASLKFIEDTIKVGGGMGVYLKNSNDMVCWALYSLVGGVGMIQTLPEFRHKGYGSLLSRALTKQIAEGGVTPQVQIRCNIPYSMEMFTAIGYRVTHLVHWFCLELNKTKNDL